MHGYGFRESFLDQRPVAAIKLTTKFILKLMQLLEKDFYYFTTFLLKSKLTKSTSLL